MNSPLISRYRTAAIKHGNCTMSGEHRKANRAYDDLNKAFAELTRIGDDHLLLKLFTDEEIWVQLWAAAHSLGINENQARDKLRQLERQDNIVGTTAKYTLQEWEDGNLKFI